MKETEFDRRSFIRDCITVGAGALGLLMGKVISDAQDSSTLEQIKLLNTKQQSLEDRLMAQQRDQQQTNSDLFQGLFGVKDQIKRIEK